MAVYRKYWLLLLPVNANTNPSGYIHACTNETHSLANLKDVIPTLVIIRNDSQHILAKVGIKSYRFAGECVPFVHAWM